MKNKNNAWNIKKSLKVVFIIAGSLNCIAVRYTGTVIFITVSTFWSVWPLAEG